MKKIEVLDKGHVELVDCMGNDLTVVNSARVSFSNHKEEFEEKDEKLIRYLFDKKIILLCSYFLSNRHI